MAVFDPQNPAQKPEEYLNYSKPISDMSGDMSGKLRIEGAGDLLGGVALADTAIKKSIQDKAYDLIDPRRDEMTAALEKIKADLEVQGQGQGTPTQASNVPLPRSDPRKANASWLDANAQAADDED